MSTRRLIVLLYDRPIGVIERDRGSLTFQYDTAYLAEPNQTQLSPSMPLAVTAYTKRQVEAFLKGLLPDNADVRRRWAARFGVKDGDTFGLIEAIGADAAGGAVYLGQRDEAARPGPWRP